VHDPQHRWGHDIVEHGQRTAHTSARL
jgi:hypothetical protein